MNIQFVLCRLQIEYPTICCDINQAQWEAAFGSPFMGDHMYSNNLTDISKFNDLNEFIDLSMTNNF